MSKIITINQDKLLMLKEIVASDSNIASHNDYCSELTEAAPEVDEYEIGDEGSNPPVGGNFYHVNESTSFDTAVIGSVNYSWDFDEEEYQEWLVDAEYENTQEALMEYITDNVEFELEYLDNEIYHTCGGDYVDYDTLEELFGAKMQSEILKTCMSDGSGSFDVDELYSEEDVDINDKNSVNDMAMRLLRHGDYFKDCRGFILTNGVVVYTESEHNEICRIPNVNNKFDFIRMGNIRVLPQSIDIGAEPTSEQRDVLRKAIASYSDEELYVDLYQGKSCVGATYTHPDWRYVMGEIDRFFSEGIKPQGNVQYEGKKIKHTNIIIESNNKNKKIVVSENTFESWFGNSILKDENGQPLKMYHGTDSEFDTFSKEHIGRTGAHEGYGFNFTPFESRARSYNSINVIEAYLKVENPMTTKSHKITLNKLIKIISELDRGKPFTDTIVAAYEPARYNEKWDAMYYRRALPIAAKIIYDYNKENNYGDAGLYAEICLCGQSDKIETINTFERLGYDSAIFYDNNDRINTVIVFEPNQIKKTSNKTFNIDSDSMNEQITNENFDFEVDSSEIDLSSFKKKHELVPNIWNPDGKLNSRVRIKLLDIADDFWDFVNLTWVKPRGIILTGSICNYNWSQYSDIDLHLIVDFDEIDEKIEFVKDYLDSKKNEWNNEHSGLQIMGYPVELYVQNLGEIPESNGIYDLEENDWIREPNPDDIKSIGLNKFSIKDKAAKIMTIIDDMYDALASTDDSHKIEQMGDDASYLWKKVKEMRKSSLEKNGESGSGNIVYKYMRRMGYLDKLWRLRTLCYDKVNSILEGKKYNVFLNGEKDETFSDMNWKRKPKVGKGFYYGGAVFKIKKVDDDNVYVIEESISSIDDNDIFALAKERFGTTNDIRECGYILPDGSMLDFSGRHMVTGDTDTSHLKGRRSVDHREIGDLNWDRDMAVRNNLNVNMANFIRKGAIRIHCSNTWSSINLLVKPTKEQINPLLRLIQYSKGNVTVEIGDGDNSYDYAEWDEANPRRVINDVMRYFNGETINLVGNITESKEIIKEYLDNDYNLPLYKYFKWASTASDFEKVKDIIYQCSYETKQYILKMSKQFDEFEELKLELIGNEDIIFEDDFVEKVANVIVTNKLTDAFIYYLQVSGGSYDLPSWVYMDFNRIVKNEWCIHFGADSESIAKEGFTGGTPDIERLAYTNAGQQKHYAGYDFAFLIDDRNVDYNEYGDEAVIFRTSGVEIYHHGDSQNQVVFWGPNVKSFIPIHQEDGDWVVYGQKGQTLFRGETPSDVANWATYNLPQYRKQIMTGKNGYIPKMGRWNTETNKYERVPYPIYRNESIKKYITLLKENTINEEWVADGNASHNPYKKRWDAERKALKDFVSNYGELMQSKENGKLYKCYYDKVLSQLVGYNYCICIQWDSVELKPKSILYIRALDKFTPNIKQVNYDTRGKDNILGNYDDLSYRNY